MFLLILYVWQFVTSSVAVFESCNTGKLNVYDKIVIKNQKKENKEIK